MDYEVIAVTDELGQVVESEWLQRAETVHRQLRPKLESDYRAQMDRVFSGGGRMLVAVGNDVVLGVAVYRINENTFDGLHCYVDDLVTDESNRSAFVGKALLNAVEEIAQGSGCRRLKLDSGTQRGRAHQFYFREGMHIASFHFSKDLD